MEYDITTGIVHGRYQPPHNGHLRYILLALEKAEHVIIGICTPKVCTDEEAALSGFPCNPARNPFTHEEREDMIGNALVAEGIDPERFSFIAFPSDYADLESVVNKNTVFFMSITSEADRKKVAHIQSLGYGTDTLVVIDEGEERESSDAIRTEAALGDESWELAVPEAVATYIKERDLETRLRLLQ
jgi:cytidyltransferase-like protein